MTGAAPGERAAAVLRPAGEIVRREIAGETILVPIRGNTADLRRIFSLNATAAFAWERFDGRRTLEEVLGEVVGAFRVDAGRARADLGELVTALRAEGLLEEAR